MLEPHKVSVLVVEDNPVSQEVIVSLLEDYGIDTHLATNGTEAVAAAKESMFDLILMDCQMPLLGGIEAASIIRDENSVFKNIPIVAVTANTMMQDRAECLAAGMNDYIGKPIKKSELDRVLAKWLAHTDILFDKPAPKATTSQPIIGRHFDQETVEKLRQLTKDRFGITLDKLVLSTEDSLARMKVGLAANDMDTVARLAHSMKAAGQVGAMELYRLAAMTEQTAKYGPAAVLSELIGALEGELAEVRREAALLKAKTA